MFGRGTCGWLFFGFLAVLGLCGKVGKDAVVRGGASTATVNADRS